MKREIPLRLRHLVQLVQLLHNPLLFPLIQPIETRLLTQKPLLLIDRQIAVLRQPLRQMPSASRHGMHRVWRVLKLRPLPPGIRINTTRISPPALPVNLSSLRIPLRITALPRNSRPRSIALLRLSLLPTLPRLSRPLRLGPRLGGTGLRLRSRSRRGMLSRSTMLRRPGPRPKNQRGRQQNAQASSLPRSPSPSSCAPDRHSPCLSSSLLHPEIPD